MTLTSLTLRNLLPDNVKDLAHHFFTRCLKAEVVPYVVTKKTVFKWQEGFWVTMKDIFDESYKQQYLDAGLLDGCAAGLLDRWPAGRLHCWTAGPPECWSA